MREEGVFEGGGILLVMVLTQYPLIPPPFRSSARRQKGEKRGFLSGKGEFFISFHSSFSMFAQFALRNGGIREAFGDEEVSLLFTSEGGGL